MSGNSERYAKLQSFRYGTPDQRQWLRATEESFAWKEGTGEDGRPVEFVRPYACHRLCERAFMSGPEGTGQIAWSLLELGASDFPRAVLSGFLTKVVRQPLDARADTRLSHPPESMVSAFGRMVQTLIEGICGKVVEWIEDMSVGNTIAGVEVQPSTLIRGLVFSSAVNEARNADFWERATRSKSFPERIFADPCHPNDGCILSPYLQRAIGRYLEWAPVAAIERFVPVIRDQTDRKTVWEFDEDRRSYRILVVPATPEEQRCLQRHVIEAMADGERRRMVDAIMFPAPKPPEPQASQDASP